MPLCAFSGAADKMTEVVASRKRRAERSPRSRGERIRYRRFASRRIGPRPDRKRARNLCESERDRKRCAHGRAQDWPVSALTPDAISTADDRHSERFDNFDRTLRHALHFGVQSVPKIASITALGRQLDATVSSSDASLTSSTSPPRLRKIRMGARRVTF